MHPGQFQHDQQQAALPEQASLAPEVTGPLQRQIGADTGKKNEQRRAEVRDPAGEEQGRRGARQIQRVEVGLVEVIAGVVERHQDHDQPPHQIDGNDAAAEQCRGWRVHGRT